MSPDAEAHCATCTCGRREARSERSPRDRRRGRVRTSKTRFKNALCLARPPEGVPGYSYPPWVYCCHRRVAHPMPHKSRWREWNEGDRESRPRSDL